MPYIDPKEVERVKQIDLLAYLQQCEPDELVRIGAGSYCTKTHDSLKLSNGRWYWWSQGFGGRSALDYLVKVKGMAFLDAVATLGAGEITVPSSNAQPAQPTLRAKKFMLPAPAKANAEAIAYLELRCIDRHIISHCVTDGLVYQTMRQGKPCVVFVGRDKTGVSRYAALRSVNGDFKGEAKGSDKRFAFRLQSCIHSDVLHVFEGAIDALSFATLELEADRDWRNLNLLSLGGVPAVASTSEHTRIPQALTQYLSDNPRTKRVHLHLDNDEPGSAAADVIASALHLRNFDISIAPPSKGKDVSEYLMMQRRPCPSEQVPLHGERLLAAGRAARKAKDNRPKER
jgi:hypothetical protein